MPVFDLERLKRQSFNDSFQLATWSRTIHSWHPQVTWASTYIAISREGWMYDGGVLSICLRHWQYDRSYTGKTPQPIASELKPPAAAKYYKHNDLSISFNFQNMSPQKIKSLQLWSFDSKVSRQIWERNFLPPMPRSTGRHCLLRPGVTMRNGTKVAELPMKIQTWATSMALKVVCSAIPWRFLRHSFSLLKHWICLVKCLLWMLFACHVLCLLWWPADMRLLESMWKNLSNAYALFLVQSVGIAQMLLLQDTRYVWVLQCGHLTFALYS